jgi:hypothetical protein
VITDQTRNRTWLSDATPALAAIADADLIADGLFTCLTGSFPRKVNYSTARAHARIACNERRVVMATTERCGVLNYEAVNLVYLNT